MGSYVPVTPEERRAMGYRELPSSLGIALAEMLQILEGYDLKAMDPAHRTHMVVEAMRRAYRDRTFFLGDPDFTHIPMQVLLSKDYALGLRSTIVLPVV